MRMRQTAAATALVLCLALTLGAQSGPAPVSDPPAARIGDRVFTVGDVEARWQADAPTRHAEVQEALYDGRRQALDALIGDYLIARAAAARGVTIDRFEDEEISRRVRPVTDQEVAAFYTANRQPGETRTLRDAAPLLREFLEDRNRTVARAELIAALRAAEPSFRVMLDAPRRAIAVDASDPTTGRLDAAVTIVEFADFQCPYCRDLAPTLQRLRAQFGDRLRLVWKDLPLTRIHRDAFKAAEAGRCAHEQGRFWEFHDRLFAAQGRLSTPLLKTYAQDVGLDAERFAACLDSERFAPGVRDAIAEAARLGLSATPSLFINGRHVSGVRSYEVLAAMVDEELRRLLGQP